MARIENKTLYALQEAPKDTFDESQTVVEVIIGAIRKNLSEGTDPVVIRIPEKNPNASRQEIRLSEFEAPMTQVGNALVAEGVQKGDFVSLYMYNNVEFYIPVLATWMAGAVPCLADPSITPDVMAQQMKVTKPKVIFCSYEAADSIKQACEKINLQTKIVLVNSKTNHPDAALITMEDFSKSFSSQDMPTGHKEVSLEDDSIILWSSGTTGNPKGIVYDHRNTLWNATHDFYSQIGNNGSLLQTTCMFHGGGFSFGLAIAMQHAFTVTTFSLRYDLKAEDLFMEASRQKATIFAMGSHHGAMLVASEPPAGVDLSSLECIIPVGAPMSPDFAELLQRRFPNAKMIINAYGMTEMGGISLGLNDFSNLGSLMPGVVLQVRDPNTGELLGPKQTGEMCVKTPVPMKKYINVSDEVINNLYTANGFFRTGDLGCYDDNGILFYKGRLKALIKYQGHHVYPAEIEELLHKHPDVLESDVFGLPEPTVMELITAAVVKREGSALTEQELEEWVNSKLSDSKKTRGGVHFVQKLPRNIQGKVQKQRLIDIFVAKKKL